MSLEESAYVRPTFTKLPFDKKERILDVAIDERVLTLWLREGQYQPDGWAPWHR